MPDFVIISFLYLQDVFPTMMAYCTLCSAHMITEAFVSKHNKCRRYTYACNVCWVSLNIPAQHSTAQQSLARWRVHCVTVEHCCQLVAIDAAANGQMHISDFSLILNLSYLFVSHYFLKDKFQSLWSYTTQANISVDKNRKEYVCSVSSKQ